MEDDINALARAFRTFITNFVNLGLDTRIGLVTTDMDVATAGLFVDDWFTSNDPQAVQKFTTQATQGFNGSADEKGLDASKAALDTNINRQPNQGFLRTQANLAVVVVSDEDDYSSIRPNTYASWLNNLKGDPDKTSFSGMVGPDGGGLQACQLGGGGSASAAPRYHDVIRMTDGVWGDFCDFEIDPFLNFLSYRAAGLLYKFDLSHTPSAVGAITVMVDGVSVNLDAYNGWTYDSQDNAVVLNGQAIPGPGAVVYVSYPYATTCQ
jgi:hypothetical protein